MAFKDVKGHEKTIILLQRAIISQRIAHAYLFIGPESIGKRYGAINFAKVINCNDPRYYDRELIDCCEVCTNCRKINEGTFPDLTLISPDKNSIKIDQMKEIQEKIQFRPVIGRGQIFIIDQAETMTQEAANCILKILEEPPEYIIFILITSNEFILPTTIVSRCQTFRFNLLGPDIVKELLKEKFNTSEEKAILYASVSNGRIDRAVEFIQKKGLEDFRRNIISLAAGKKSDYIWKVTTEKEKINIEKVNIYKSDEKISFSFPSNKINLFFDFMLMWYRDLLLFKQIKLKDRLINIDELRIIKKESEDLPLQELFSRINSINKAKDNIRKNSNVRLVMENLLNYI